MCGGGVQGGEASRRVHSAVPLVIIAILSAALLGASYLKSDWTGNDFERFDDLRLSFLFFVILAGLCAAYVGIYARADTAAPRVGIAIWALCAGLLLASFPVGSKDVLGYAFLGRMWGHYGVNPYVVSPQQFASDPWQPFLANTLRRPLSVYGPLFLWQALLVDAVAGESLWLAVWLHKALATMLFGGVLLVANAIVRRTTLMAPARLFLLLALNPLFLFESAASGHNDIAMVWLLLAALWCWSAGHANVALCLLVLSFWYKLYGLIFIPFFLAETAKVAGLRAAVRQVGVCLAAAVVAGAVLLLPLPGALPALAGGLLHPEKMRGIFPTELSPPLALLFWALRASGAFATDLGFRIFDVTRFALCTCALLAILWRQWHKPSSLTVLAESCFLTGLAVFMLLITQLWPWHVLTVVACGILCGREPFVLVAVALSVAALLSHLLTFAVATLMLVLVIGALWLLRAASLQGMSRLFRSVG